MHLLAVQSRYSQPPHSELNGGSLSPTARDQICKLLRHSNASESANRLAFKTRLSADQCTHLDKILHKIYPDQAALQQNLLRLDHLVYLHTKLQSKTFLSPGSSIQLHQIEQEIFQLLGFRE
jgi:hypothetical protein